MTEVPLHFSPPMVASWRLLTSNTRKFVHVTLKSTVAHLIKFELTDPKLECDGNNKVSDLNPKNVGNMVSVSIIILCRYIIDIKACCENIKLINRKFLIFNACITRDGQVGYHLINPSGFLPKVPGYNNPFL